VQGYLNYQVIHHLFPSMPQCYGPLVSRELRVKAKEWGITYTTVSCVAVVINRLAGLLGVTNLLLVVLSSPGPLG
jgi:hypothetical protein